MNKQELINELTKYVERYEDATDEYDQGKSSAYEVALKLVKKLRLDEPQKPIVPQFVAEWFEENKDNLEFAIWELCVDSYNAEAEPGIIDWIQCPENNPIETLIRMKDGYEVEKEPLYYVVFDILQEQKFLVKNIKTKLFYLSNNENVIGNYEQVSFTEQEIKAIDERYWAFAVPVEEVVE